MFVYAGTQVEPVINDSEVQCEITLIATTITKTRTIFLVIYFRPKSWRKRRRRRKKSQKTEENERYK